MFRVGKCQRGNGCSVALKRGFSGMRVVLELLMENSSNTSIADR